MKLGRASIKTKLLLNQKPSPLMEKYEQLSIVGEGSYGVVTKCRHKELDQVVAVKKFQETEDDLAIRRVALREIKMLKKLKHENLVALIDAFRYRKRFYLVFEYLNGTILDEMEKVEGGLGEERTRERLYQILRAVNYCHFNQVIHRDIKPENVLVSSSGVVKLCDFGFARHLSNTNETLTDYVATRWYRAPELLVGDQNYNTAVDVWAIGCLFAEMLTGEPLFPGDSDIDQLYLIVQTFGRPCPRHQQMMIKNSALRAVKTGQGPKTASSILRERFPKWPNLSIEILLACMKMDPSQRLTAEDLLRHPYFNHDNFSRVFVPALREKVHQEYNSNPLLRKIKADILYSTDRHEDQRWRRRPSPCDPMRWKFHFPPPERKQDNKTTPKIVATPKNKDRLLLPKDYRLDYPNANNAADMYMLEKSLESLARLSLRNKLDGDQIKEPINSKPTNQPYYTYQNINNKYKKKDSKMDLTLPNLPNKTGFEGDYLQVATMTPRMQSSASPS